MIQNITVRIHPEWKGKISDLSKTAKEMESDPDGVTKNSAILSKESVELSIKHPYSEYGGNKYRYWNALEPTPLEIGSNTLCAKPYAWIMFEIEKGRFKKSQKNWDKFGIKINKAEEASWYEIDNFNENYASNVLKRKRTKSGCFLQKGEDQKIVFDKFFSNVEKDKSLCFIYAKWAEFTEKPQRILVGIGHVLNKQEPPQYAGNNEIECRLWETRLQHSIEKDGDDCVLLPYDELQKYAESDKNFNINDYVVFASDDFRNEFSYGTEWLSYDGAIDTILRTKKVLEKLESLLARSFEKQQKWLDNQLKAICEDRWIYPGLGEMLYAFGLRKNWEEIANYAIECMKSQHISFKEALAESFKKQRAIDDSITEHYSRWNLLPLSKQNLFELLSRMALTEKQAGEFFDRKEFGKWAIWVDAEEILKNPYLIYERFAEKNDDDVFPFAVVDNAMFPQYLLKDDEVPVFDLPESSKMKHSEDLRRVHALIVKVLKEQTQNGNSIYPADLTREEIANEVLSAPCSPGRSVFENVEQLSAVSDSFEKVSLKIDGKESFGFQLKSNKENKTLIKDTVLEFADGSEEIDENWEEICSELEENSEDQRTAKSEKICILSKMASSKIFVLNGGAGTGKTTLLSLFTSSREIREGGVLALAPTGKAKVRMEEAFNNDDKKIKFNTIASFLMPFNRYIPVTGTGKCKYDHRKYPDRDKTLPDIPKTVIIDECSMLTEDMLAALLVTVKDSANRIILSGDTNQLPPIGCGRPFLDILTYFKKDEFSPESPNIGAHFGELQIIMRQNGENRSDLAFAQCFKRSCTKKDLKFFKQDTPDDERLKIKTFGGQEDLETCIYDTLNNDFEIDPSKILVDCEGAIGDWEILSPTRNDKFGSLRINEIVRKLIPTDAERTTSEEFIPVQKGDKVICVKNRKNDTAFEDGKKCNNDDYCYVANGDIGYVCEIENGNKKTYRVMYNGQSPCYHKYHDSAFKNDSSEEAPLEYAYALTVHKCQGSQFGKTLVVLNKNSLMLTRELLYTAFSRQKDKLVVLFNGNFKDLGKYCDFTFSAVAKRLTNLMIDEPSLIIKDGVCFDEIYTKQDAEVTALYREQVEQENGETTRQEIKHDVAEVKHHDTEKTAKKTSIFGSIIRKIKSIFSR